MVRKRLGVGLHPTVVLYHLATAVTAGVCPPKNLNFPIRPTEGDMATRQHPVIYYGLDALVSSFIQN